MIGDCFRDFPGFCREAPLSLGHYPSTVYLVAIAALTGPLDSAVAPLAAALETTVYELRLLLNAGFPAVVLATVDPDLARAAAGAVKRAGHRVVTLDRADMTANREMTALSAFRFDSSELIASDGAARLPYEDIGALLRATHRSATETTEVVKGRELRPIAAIATGGLVISKKTTREVTTRTEHREQVSYLFRRSGAPAWILRERGTDYRGLGTVLQPTSLANFQSTIQEIRKRAPDAAYDERLMNARPIRGVADGPLATDMLAHLVAKDLLGTG